MENQCSVKYIFAVTGVKECSPANSSKLGGRLRCPQVQARGLGRKVKLLLTATLLHLEKCPRGMRWCRPCGGCTSGIPSDAENLMPQNGLQSRPVSGCPVCGLQPSGSEPWVPLTDGLAPRGSWEATGHGARRRQELHLVWVAQEFSVIVEAGAWH